MPRTRPDLIWRSLAVLALAALVSVPAGTAPTSRHLVIVVDGLRPDYVTPEVMPNLIALGQRGVVFNRHHSVYPTVTRVNASSISTGAYPERHGLMGNSVFFPRVDATKFLDTSNRSDLLRIAAREGRLLTAPTLAESLQASGRRMLVVSSGSTGSAFLNNHTVSGGAVLHYEFALPATLGDDLKPLGFPLADQAPDVLDRFAVDAFLKVGLPKVDPSATVMWLSGLDTVAHDKGIGAPETVAILKKVDAEIARIQEGLKSAGLFEQYNIWVTSDHGFSTHTGGVDLGAILRPFAGTLADGSPRIVAGGGAIYVRDRDAAATAGIVAALQRTPGVGAIFTREARPGSFDGAVPGTLSFSVARWSHDRAADILFSPEWSDAPNAAGIRGSVASGGTAGHGSSSPWDIHNTLIAAGADLKKGARVEIPSANVDLAPTFLRLWGLPVADSMQGRPLEEAFASASGPAPAVREGGATAALSGGSYSATATFSYVTAGGKEYRYLDRATATRTR